MITAMRSCVFVGVASGMLWAVGGQAQPPATLAQVPATLAQVPATLAQVPAVPMPEPGAQLQPRAAVPPRNTGPAARSHSRYRRGRHGTTRIIRRTPEVMREDAARVKRGDLFSTWSNEYLE